ncbi:hypothetical protein [Lentzea sp. NPDC059081]|uniref:hypothetical protein n=1 Tax=Lentzea sp. NPDC059081 TaxID=3346719 RepID=UPI00368DA3CE
MKAASEASAWTGDVTTCTTRINSTQKALDVVRASVSNVGRKLVGLTGIGAVIGLVLGIMGLLVGIAAWRVSLKLKADEQNTQRKQPSTKWPTRRGNSMTLPHSSLLAVAQIMSVHD